MIDSERRAACLYPLSRDIGDCLGILVWIGDLSGGGHGHAQLTVMRASHCLPRCRLVTVIIGLMKLTGYPEEAMEWQHSQSMMEIGVPSWSSKALTMEWSTACRGGGPAGGKISRAMRRWLSATRLWLSSEHGRCRAAAVAPAASAASLALVPPPPSRSIARHHSLVPPWVCLMTGDGLPWSPGLTEPTSPQPLHSEGRPNRTDSQVYLLVRCVSRPYYDKCKLQEEYVPRRR